jgi:hypothetical protein
MTRPADWLQAQVAAAPARLRERMLAELPDTQPTHDALAQAADACLRRALRDPAGPHAALDLLAADALLTHACAAAAAQGDTVLAAFTAALDTAHFQQLLDESA